MRGGDVGDRRRRVHAPGFGRVGVGGWLGQRQTVRGLGICIIGLPFLHFGPFGPIGLADSRVGFSQAQSKRAELRCFLFQNIFIFINYSYI
jgi:hypothetical protein